MKNDHLSRDINRSKLTFFTENDKIKKTDRLGNEMELKSKMCLLLIRIE